MAASAERVNALVTSHRSGDDQALDAVAPRHLDNLGFGGARTLWLEP